MKKVLKRALAFALCLCVPASLLVTASAASGSSYAGDWQYVEDDSGSYWKLDAVYCTNPTIIGGEAVQHLVIYAPAAYMTKTAGGAVVNPEGKVAGPSGMTYTAQTAPIIYYNTSGGYSSSSIKDVDMNYLKQGYVYVNIATRGKETKDDAGKYIGQFPALIVDLKAGIRFLKANDAVFPGSSERIISVGGSSGGAVSAMLGTSGNSPVFDEYLSAIGAAKTSDDIFMAVCWCPITNLNSNDAAYEWFMSAAGEYFLFNAMAVDMNGKDISDVMPVGPANYYPLGSNILGGNHEDELSAWLYNWYVDYVQSFGLDLGDDGRSGSYYDDLSQAYADSLAEYIARYDEVKTDRMPATVDEFIASISGIAELDENGNVIYYDDNGVEVYQQFEAGSGFGQSVAYYVYHNEDGSVRTDEAGNVIRLDRANTAFTGENWFSYDAATGEVKMTLDSFIQGYISKNQSALGNNTAIKRNKMCPSLDSYNYKSNENDAFVDEDGNRLHFSKVVLQGLQELQSGAYTWTDEEKAYIDALVAAYSADIAEESDEMLEIMSPINYVVGNYESDFAPYFRWKIGSADGDQGAPAGWLTHEALLKYHPEVESNYAISWGVGHGNSELSMNDLYSYINSVMQDNMPAAPAGPAAGEANAPATGDNTMLWAAAAAAAAAGAAWLYLSGKKRESEG